MKKQVFQPKPRIRLPSAGQCQCWVRSTKNTNHWAYFVTLCLTLLKTSQRWKMPTLISRLCGVIPGMGVTHQAWISHPGFFDSEEALLECDSLDLSEIPTLGWSECLCRDVRRTRQTPSLDALVHILGASVCMDVNFPAIQWKGTVACWKWRLIKKFTFCLCYTLETHE